MRIGIVGVGFMGMIHFLAANRVAGVAVGAVLSRDERKRAGDWRGIRGNFGPAGEVVDLAGVRAYAEYDDLLRDPAIELVDLCTPTPTHAELAIRALEAGKHVLVEKPIALTMADADAMVEAARRHGRRLMVAHVLPFFPEFAFALAAVREGRFGRLLAGHLLRVISQPDWSDAANDSTKTGGPAIDLHIHDTHFVALLAGLPREVVAAGRFDGEHVSHLATHYRFGPNGPVISSTCGALASKARPFVHGFELYFERATLVFQSGTCPLTVHRDDGRSERPTLGDDDPISAFAEELRAAAQSIHDDVDSPILNCELSRDALGLCHREIESARSERGVAV